MQEMGVWRKGLREKTPVRDPVLGFLFREKSGDRLEMRACGCRRRKIFRAANQVSMRFPGRQAKYLKKVFDESGMFDSFAVPFEKAGQTRQKPKTSDRKKF
jgi:hypothetical protein